MAIPFMAGLSYVKMYWKLFLVGASALFISYLFYCIYSLKQESNKQKIEIVQLTEENKNISVANERNQATIGKLEAEILNKDKIFRESQQNNKKGFSDIKKLIAGLDTNSTFGENLKECNCSNIKIIKTSGDFIHETISNIGNLSK